jgi:hypothetical protein
MFRKSISAWVCAVLAAAAQGVAAQTAVYPSKPLAKSSPGKLNYASAGAATNPHIAG